MKLFSDIMFDRILEDCRLRYKPFRKVVEKEREPLSFAEAIKKATGKPVISEVKFSSPGGRVREFEAPKKIALEMEKGGACGISVLTEEKYFNGSIDYLRAVKEAVSVPVLRKDFIFDSGQVDEAYYYGADSLLLISSFFSSEKLELLIEKSRSFGIEPLVEIHSFDDIERAHNAGAEIYVINNRDKDTLEINLERSREFGRVIKGAKISASGISTIDELNYVLKYCDAVLIGTSIMKSRDVKNAVEVFVNA